MNIFNNINAFFQTSLLDELLEAEQALFQTVLQLRQALGERAYLLDHYLSLIFEVLQIGCVENLAEQGTWEYSRINSQARKLNNGETISQEDLAFLQKSLDQVKNTYKETETILHLTTALAAPEMLADAFKTFIMWASLKWKT